MEQTGYTHIVVVARPWYKLPYVLHSGCAFGGNLAVPLQSEAQE